MARLRGHHHEDEWGFDQRLAEAVYGLFELVNDLWWRAEIEGVRNVPAHGGALLVADRAGPVAPFDAAMITTAIMKAHPLPRWPRCMVDQRAFALPFLSGVMRRCGAVPATPENVIGLLGRGELVAVFSKTGFARLAARARVPIVRLSSPVHRRGGSSFARRSTASPAQPDTIARMASTATVIRSESEGVRTGVRRAEFRAALEQALERRTMPINEIGPVVGATRLRLRFEFTDCDLALNVDRGRARPQPAGPSTDDPGWAPKLVLGDGSAVANATCRDSRASRSRSPGARFGSRRVARGAPLSAGGPAPVRRLPPRVEADFPPWWHRARNRLTRRASVRVA